MESGENYTIGKRIMFLRKQAGMTQEQLAERLGVTPQAVSKWENDNSCPDISMLPAIAEVFGVSTDALLGREPLSAPAAIPAPDGGKEPSSPHRKKDGGLFFGVAVILIGAAYLISHFGNWDFNLLGVVWPALMLGLGVSWAVRDFSPLGLGVALLGLYYLLANLGVEMPFAMSWSVIWPCALILLGLTVLTDKLRQSRYHDSFEAWRHGRGAEDFHTTDGFVKLDAAFTEMRRSIQGAFRGGDVDLSFGSVTLDLTEAQVQPGARLEADVSFGCLELWLPRSLRVDSATRASLGAVNVHGEPNADAVLFPISGDVSFGSIEIRYK